MIEGLQRFKKAVIADWNKNRKTYIFYLILFLSLFVNFFFLRIEEQERFRLTFNAIKKTVAETSLLFLFCLIFRGKWKIIVIVIPIAVSIYIISNVLYMRYFMDLIPPRMYTSVAVWNNATLNGAGAAFKWYDVLIFLFSVSPALYSFIVKNFYKVVNPNCSILIIEISLLLVSWVLVLRTIYITQSKYYDNGNLIKIYRELTDSIDENWRYTYKILNLTGHLLRSGISFQSIPHHEPTAEEWEHIKEYLETKPSTEPIEKDSVISFPQNLIVIVVESLPVKALEIEETSFVAPFTSELINNKNNDYVKLRSLAGLGNSSDAQFIYNTGLLPLRNEVLVLTYGINDYPSLAKVFPGESVEIIGEDGFLWNHYETTKSYGFDRLIDKTAQIGVLNQDSLLFSRAEEELKKLHRPFFMFLTTLSMHGNYDSTAVTTNLNTSLIAKYDKREREYLQRLNHFDRQLEKFITRLQKSSEFENTLIIICGDHPPLQQYGLDSFADTNVPLIIINSPLKQKARAEGTQADLFPTILQLLNLNYKYKGIEYRGIGNSLYQPNLQNLKDEDYQISETLIKSHL